ncbi:MAG: fused response regulator/phosphatase [Spirochaetes bacterium]|nr:fused response regulator/phosphatase [Spirochaetota bacterium]
MTPLAVPEPSPARAVLPQGGARILVADDHAENRELLRLRLAGKGHEVTMAVDGAEALDLVRSGGFDLLLLDVLMPVMNGMQVLERIKADPDLKDLPVIMISAHDELESVVHAVKAGAEDYLPKPFEPTLLFARIAACLGKKRALDRERETFQALIESQRALAKELGEAAEYVRSLMPARLDAPVATDWRYLPSTQLGGDALGYQWLDDDHFAFHVLDVCGHGVGSALHSISVVNILRARFLPDTDFRHPGEVLAALNRQFPMERHNGLYFTLWYGVYHRPTRRLRWANGGHPSPVLFSPAGRKAESLLWPGTPVGIGGELSWSCGERVLEPGQSLTLFSDGLYEIKDLPGGVPTYEEFVEILSGLSPAGAPQLDPILKTMRGLSPTANLDDDVTLLSLTFP